MFLNLKNTSSQRHLVKGRYKKTFRLKVLKSFMNFYSKWRCMALKARSHLRSLHIFVLLRFCCEKLYNWVQHLFSRKTIAGARKIVSVNETLDQLLIHLYLYFSGLRIGGFGADGWMTSLPLQSLLARPEILRCSIGIKSDKIPKYPCPGGGPSRKVMGGVVMGGGSHGRGSHRWGSHGRGSHRWGSHGRGSHGRG